MQKEKRTALSLGGNIGNVAANFHFAVKELEGNGLKNTRLSSFYKTTPLCCPPGTPDFLNAALTGNWERTAHALLDVCQEIEQKSGRSKFHGINLPRTLDIDIIFFGEDCFCDKRLTIPHKKAFRRFFVLAPLKEIAGDWTFPGKNLTVQELFALEKQKYH